MYSPASSEENKTDFVPVDEFFVSAILKGKQIKFPTLDEIELILKNPGMHYQEIKLPYGKSTSKGNYSHLVNNRSMTFEKIFENEDLRGVSILDVGYALGQMLFLAENLGTENFCGLEPHNEIHSAAESLVQVLNSDVRIIKNSVEDFYIQNVQRGDNENFDWVLALNVIHHVTDIHKFCEIISQLANRFIAIEFPTLGEKNWRGSESVYMLFLRKFLSRSKFPLAGVGTKGYDSTFAFNDYAIKVLIESKTNGKFTSKHFFESPIANRKIAIFENKNSTK